MFKMSKTCKPTDLWIMNKKNVLEAEEDSYYIRDGIVVIPKHTVIPDNTII